MIAFCKFAFDRLYYYLGFHSQFTYFYVFVSPIIRFGLLYK